MIVFYGVSVAIEVLLSPRHQDQAFVRDVKNIISALVYNLLLELPQFVFIQEFLKASDRLEPPWQAALSVYFHLWRRLLVGQCWGGSINSISSLSHFRGMLYRNHQKRRYVLLSRQKVYYQWSSCIFWRFRIGPLQRIPLQRSRGIGRSTWANSTLVHHLFILWFHHLVHWVTSLIIFEVWQLLHK